MIEISPDDITLSDQLHALWEIASYRPGTTGGVIVLSIFTALLEGLGLTFLAPVIEISQGNTSPNDVSNVGEAFLNLFEFFGIPFALEYVIVGAAAVMVIRYSMSFVVAWFKIILQKGYVRHLQTEGFNHILSARVAYHDQQGSDEILNAIVTQAEYSGNAIGGLVRLVQQTALCLVYIAIALYIAPLMTLLSGVLLSVPLLLMRYVVESGYTVGDRVAEANERIHKTAQAGTQGIRDVKLFSLTSEMVTNFQDAADAYYENTVKKVRNEAAMDNIYQMLTAVTLFS